MLDAMLPITTIYGTIYPEHLTITLSLILLVITFLSVTRFPLKFTIPVFLIILIFSFILIIKLLSISRFLAPFTLSMLDSILELSSICISIRPLILTKPIWITVVILSNVLISIRKEI